MTRVSIVPRDHAEDIWAFVEPHLAKALKRGGGDYNAADARRLVMSGHWQLWIATQPGRLVATALTEAVEFPRRKVLWCIAAGGELDEGMAAIEPQLRAHAAQRGCTAMRFLGRRGWLRSGALPGDWAHTHDVATVEL